MINFEIRKNDPTIPRNAVKRTSRDDYGKRIDASFESKPALKPTELRKTDNNVQKPNVNLGANKIEKALKKF
jgi:hypothetical protein